MSMSHLLVPLLLWDGQHNLSKARYSNYSKERFIFPKWNVENCMENCVSDILNLTDIGKSALVIAKNLDQH